MVVVSLPTLEELRQFVRKTLCDHDKLDLEETPFYEGQVTRRGQPCGLFFQAHGPRMLKFYAIWTAEEHRILFYDAIGVRFHEVRVSEAPEVSKLAA